MTNNIPKYAIAAHGFLHSVEVSPQGEPIWNDELLSFVAEPFRQAISELKSRFASIYYTDNPADLDGPLFNTFRAIANMVAYSPDNNLSPNDIAKAFSGSLSSAQDRSLHIGASPLRLASFMIFVAENGLFTQDLGAALANMNVFIQNESLLIATAFFIAADHSPQIINTESLVAKRGENVWCV